MKIQVLLAFVCICLVKRCILGQQNLAVDNTALGVKKNPGIDICTLPSDAGLCGAQLTRYYYNPTTTHCEEFIYGGCGGNENNFETVFECGRTCGQTMPADTTGIAFPFI